MEDGWALLATLLQHKSALLTCLISDVTKSPPPPTNTGHECVLHPLLPAVHQHLRHPAAQPAGGDDHPHVSGLVAWCGWVLSTLIQLLKDPEAPPKRTLFSHPLSSLNSTLHRHHHH